MNAPPPPSRSEPGVATRPADLAPTLVGAIGLGMTVLVGWLVHNGQAPWLVLVLGGVLTAGAAFIAQRVRVHARRMAKLIEERNTELQAIIDAIPAFIYYKDDANTILGLNQTAADALGQPVEAIRGRKSEEFFPAADAAAFLRDDLEVMATGRAKLGIIQELETEHDGRRQIRTDKIPLRGLSGTVDRLVAVAMDITEITKARDELGRTQRRLERAVRGSSDGLWDYLPETGEVWYSDRFKQLVGYAEDEYDLFEGVVESWSDLLHPADREPTLASVERHLRGEGPYDVTYRLRMRGGEYRWFRARGQASRDEEAGVMRMSGSLTDIDDQRWMEERLSLAMKASRIGLWDWDLASGETYFSDTFYTMLGYEPGELPMCLKTWQDLCHPDDLESAMADVTSHLEGQVPLYRNEHRLRMKDGSWLWIRDVGEITDRDESGAPTRMLGVHIDIDASKRLDEALRSSVEIRVRESERETLTQICRAVAEVLGVDFVGIARVEDPEVAWSARLVGGWSDGADVAPFEYDLQDTPCAVVVREEFCLHRSGVTSVYPNDELLRDMGAESYAGLRLQDSQGRYLGLITIVHSEPLDLRLDFEATLRLFAARVSAELERLDHEARLRAAKEAAEAASVSKSEFLANMSHEIRTPMTAILGFADLLGGDGHGPVDPQTSTEAIRAIRGNADHLMAIVNDILDMSKIEAGKMTVETIETNPAAIVEDVASLMHHRARGKGFEIQVVYDGRIPVRINSDPTRLRQILLNLVGNAVKFTEQGKVTIRTSYDAPSGMMRFAVEDTGIGMTAEQRVAIASFDAFRQADGSMARKFGGTGLGLRISDSLARMLGGSIAIASEPGLGSTFTVSVATGHLAGVRMLRPEQVSAVVARGRAEGDERISGSTDISLAGLRILLAEDGPDNQRLVSFHLRRAGAEFAIAENGREACEQVEAAAAAGAPFDLVLMDMQMPEVDGYAATRALRTAGHTLPIIAFTALAMDGDERRCRDSGCDDYLTKPIDVQGLLEVCARWGSAARRGPAGSEAQASSRTAG